MVIGYENKSHRGKLMGVVDLKGSLKEEHEYTEPSRERKKKSYQYRTEDSRSNKVHKTMQREVKAKGI